MKKKSFFVLALGLMLTAGLVLTSCAGTEDDYKIGLLTGIAKTDITGLSGTQVFVVDGTTLVAATDVFENSASFDWLKNAAGDDIKPKTPDAFASASLAFIEVKNNVPTGDQWAGSGKFDLIIATALDFTSGNGKRLAGVSIYGNPVQVDYRSFE